MTKERDKPRKPKKGTTYKQFRDETTGRFVSKEAAEQQAGTGNVMVHRREREPRRTH